MELSARLPPLRRPPSGTPGALSWASSTPAPKKHLRVWRPHRFTGTPPRHNVVRPGRHTGPAPRHAQLLQAILQPALIVPRTGFFRWSILMYIYVTFKLRRRIKYLTYTYIFYQRIRDIQYDVLCAICYILSNTFYLVYRLYVKLCTVLH